MVTEVKTSVPPEATLVSAVLPEVKLNVTGAVPVVKTLNLTVAKVALVELEYVEPPAATCEKEIRPLAVSTLLATVLPKSVPALI